MRERYERERWRRRRTKNGRTEVDTGTEGEEEKKDTTKMEEELVKILMIRVGLVNDYLKKFLILGVFWLFENQKKGLKKSKVVCFFRVGVSERWQEISSLFKEKKTLTDAEGTPTGPFHPFLEEKKQLCMCRAWNYTYFCNQCCSYSNHILYKLRCL